MTYMDSGSPLTNEYVGLLFVVFVNNACNSTNII